ncbi:MAG: TIGR04282 family arsenosugar biosynthesis glycosyltransferase [Deltaproteobacteria bacterium]|nr:TIGR04282 family arsenosugar biosynthesis glycosyltransferase [Deltaproteobacteria bacterium]
MTATSARVPVCVFAKPPVIGAAKTRLSPQIGALAAARLAQAFFEDTWATVRALSWARPILATTTRDATAFGLPPDVELWDQGSGDLGARMERILARAVAEAGRAIVLGADLPGLPGHHLEVARMALANHDAVLGPADDGGFYLLGLARVPPGLLADLPWSSSETLHRTEQRLRSAGLTTTRAPYWFDVDEPRDLVRLRSLLARHPVRAPRTHAALSRLSSRTGGGV